MFCCFFTRYNEAVVTWNNSYFKEFSGTNFFCRIQNFNYTILPVTSSYGSYYPYRDTCDLKGDNPCLSYPILYHSAVIPVSSPELHSISLFSQNNSAVSSFFNLAIPYSKEFIVSRENIGCSEGSQ